MNIETLKNLGKIDRHEIKNASLVLGLNAIGLYLYSVLINYFNPQIVELKWVRNFFALIFLAAALAPYTKKKWVYDNYGWFIFFPLLLFGHYLIYTTGANNFSIDFLLGTYIVFFGSILLISSRFLLLVCSLTQFLHMLWQAAINKEIDIITETAVVISITTIFGFSFIVVNNLIKYREHRDRVQRNLENNVKKRTKELENYSKELFEKNEDLENFAAVISHDLKTPLRNIHSLSSWLLEDNQGTFDDETQKNLETIKEQVYQMDLLIDGVLNYSLNSESEILKKPVDVNEVIDKIIASSCSNKCKIKIRKELPVIYIDETQLLQVFQNLIQNAVKHNDKEIAKVEIDYEEDGNMYVFFVKDNGPGIEERYFDRIFQLFQQLKRTPAEGSVGIGLSIVKKIINRNGGEIWLKNNKDRGTTFYFSLPKIKDPQENS